MTTLYSIRYKHTYYKPNNITKKRENDRVQQMAEVTYRANCTSSMSTAAYYSMKVNYLLTL